MLIVQSLFLKAFDCSDNYDSIIVSLFLRTITPPHDMIKTKDTT